MDCASKDAPRFGMTLATEERISQDYQLTRKTVRQIAEENSVCPKTVYNILDRRGIERKRIRKEAEK